MEVSMKLLLTGIVVFLVIVYIYTYIRYKKNKKRNVNLVDEFKRKYLQKESQKNDVDDEFIKYTTKYNSTIDYIDRDDLIKESQEMKEPKIKPTPKRLQF